MTTHIRLSNKTAKVTSSFNWPVVSLLLVINAIPAIPAIFILLAVGLGIAGFTVDSELINPVYYQQPVVIFTHGVFGVLFFLTAPFQFSNYLRDRFRQWHRIAGCITILSGIGIALSGIAMHQMLTPEVTGARYISLLIFSALMSLGFVIGFYYALKGNYTAHRHWMYRAIAISATPVTLLFIEITFNLLFAQLQVLSVIQLFLFDYGRLVVVTLNLIMVEYFVNNATRSSRSLLPVSHR